MASTACRSTLSSKKFMVRKAEVDPDRGTAGAAHFTQEFNKKRGESWREGRCAKRRGRDVSDDFGFPFYLTLSLVAQMLILFPPDGSPLRNI